jgi:hypothetical protein
MRDETRRKLREIKHRWEDNVTCNMEEEVFEDVKRTRSIIIQEQHL